MFLDGVLTIPSVGHLQHLSNALTVDLNFSEATISYLKVRLSKLKREKSVALVLDEVYSSKRVEYVGGHFLGAENDGVTKTLLCIMIKSLGGK